ncbi:Arylsulfatase A [Ekhidna lutea]|uniref:Arylsulfatase A n=1 Tax=Ekhidna lutea TaxID=447679 RepID=A0A239FI36_EKHLU|nr:sulfatase-like hydrolase/transferase [Ekhidna lutea]SNS56401.1 Arylsulfatase A [Ekhidna lutea]
MSYLLNRWIKSSFSLILMVLTSCNEEGGINYTAINQPNIVLILSDDLGYDDIKLYNESGLETPYLEELAKEGVALKRGYVTAPVCSPSRVGIFSGRYQERFGYYNNPYPSVNQDLVSIPSDNILLSEFLKNYGYSTGLIGKWHIGKSKDYHPLNKGFDYFYGTVDGPLNYLPLDDSLLIKTGWNPPVKNNLEENFEPVSNYNYLTDEFTEKAISFIEENRNTPFFLTVSYTSPHDPWQSIPKYYNQIDLEDGTRRVYLSMIKSLDEGIGHITKAISENGLKSKTIVIFISDNGCKNIGPNVCSLNPSLKGHKGSIHEGGIRVPFIIKDPYMTSSQIEGLLNRNISSLDIYASLSHLITGKVPEKLDGNSLYMPNSAELFWKYGNQAAVLSGDFKLISTNGEYELYNLKSDPKEQFNLDNQPLVQQELQEALFEWESIIRPAKW